MTIAIIGAGVAGLYCAKELIDHGQDVVLIEAKPSAGGRISTEREEGTGDVLFERGPWRIPADHSRARALCAQLDIPLKPSTKPVPHEPAPPQLPGLSIWDCNMLKTMNPADADRCDRETGYPDQTRAASGSSPYVSDATNYFVAPDGLDSITAKLMAHITNKAAVLLNTMVKNVERYEKGYAVTFSKRKDSNTFESQCIHADKVIICVPPHAWKGWAVAEPCSSVIEAVESMSLYHIYAKGKPFPSAHTVEPTGQAIPSQYGNEWHQVMYSSGRLADFWYRLRMANPSEFVKRIGRPLRTLSSHYWQHALHFWRPVFGFNLHHAVRMSVEPNPALLPGLYLANESHSSFQAWIEGALEMAQLCLARILHGDRLQDPGKVPKEHLTIDGWVVDVGKWKEVHPGSKKAIEAHLKDGDSTALFNHIGHSHVAKATLHALKHSPTPQ